MMMYDGFVNGVVQISGSTFTRDFSSTGSWSEDNRRGRALAYHVIATIKRERNPLILRDLLREFRGDFNGVHTGFLSVVGEVLMDADY